MEDLDISEKDVEKMKEAKRCTWISAVVNVFLSVFQMVVGFFSGSQGLIADGIHSLSDLFADGVVLLAVHHGAKEADDDHHYGHRRFENVASLIIGFLLAVIGVGMLWSAGVKMTSGDEIRNVGQEAIWVALAALAMKEGLFRYMLSVAKRLKSSLLVANAWHARSDAASSLVVSFGIVGNMMGWKFLDPLSAAVVGTMVFRMGYSFVKESLRDLSDGSADDEMMSGIREKLLSVPGVLGVHDLKTRKSGDMFHVDVHLEIDGSISVHDGHAIASAAKKGVIADFPVLYVMTHVDPV